MSIEINPVYHWSPRERLKSICRKGLVPNSPSVRCGYTAEEDWTAPYICCGTTAKTAWNYCLAVPHLIYDLWEIYLTEKDRTSYPENNYGNRIVEVRIHNRIPKSRLIWVSCVDSCWSNIKSFKHISETVPR